MKNQKILKINILIISSMLLNSCMHPTPSNAIEELGSEVIKKHEGIDIRLMPLAEEKVKKNQKENEKKKENKSC